MPLDFPIEPTTTALLVLDMQNGFCHPDGARAQAGADISLPMAVVQPITQLVVAARDVGIPVIWSRQIHYADDQTRRRRVIPSHLDRGKEARFNVLRGTWDAELLDVFKEMLRDEDEIIIKHRPSCFFDTNLNTLLRIRGLRMLIITGVSTPFCVESTIRDAYALDYDVVVPRDAVGSSYPDFHDATLRKVQTFFGVVTTTAELIAKLRRDARAGAASGRPAP